MESICRKPHVYQIQTFIGVEHHICIVVFSLIKNTLIKMPEGFQINIFCYILTNSLVNWVFRKWLTKKFPAALFRPIFLLNSVAKLIKPATKNMVLLNSNNNGIFRILFHFSWGKNDCSHIPISCSLVYLIIPI